MIGNLNTAILVVFASLMAGCASNSPSPVSLADARAWQQASAANTIPAYKGYLSSQQSGAHKDEAAERLSELVTPQMADVNQVALVVDAKSFDAEGMPSADLKILVASVLRDRGCQVIGEDCPNQVRISVSVSNGVQFGQSGTVYPLADVTLRLTYKRKDLGSLFANSYGYEHVDSQPVSVSVSTGTTAVGIRPWIDPEEMLKKFEDGMRARPPLKIDHDTQWKTE